MPTRMTKTEKQAAYDEWYLSEIDKGLEDIEAGHVVSDEEADRAIKATGENVRKSPFLYREGKRTGTREYTMRRFPFTLIYRKQRMASASSVSSTKRQNTSTRHLRFPPKQPCRESKQWPLKSN